MPTGQQSGQGLKQGNRDGIPALTQQCWKDQQSGVRGKTAQYFIQSHISNYRRSGTNVLRKSDPNMVCLRHIHKLGNPLCILAMHCQSAPGYPDFLVTKSLSSLGGVGWGYTLPLAYTWWTEALINISPLQHMLGSLALFPVFLLQLHHSCQPPVKPEFFTCTWNPAPTHRRQGTRC